MGSQDHSSGVCQNKEVTTIKQLLEQVTKKGSPPQIYLKPDSTWRIHNENKDLEMKLLPLMKTESNTTNINLSLRGTEHMNFYANDSELGPALISLKGKMSI